MLMDKSQIGAPILEVGRQFLGGALEYPELAPRRWACYFDPYTSRMRMMNGRLIASYLRKVSRPMR